MEDQVNKLPKEIHTLTDAQLKEVVVAVGIEFEGGVESLKERDGLSIRDQLILVLDEAEPEDLIHEIHKVLSKGTKA